MKFTSVIATGILLALFAIAGGSTPMQSQVLRTHVGVKDNRPPKPVINRNPHPTAYEVNVAIKDAPGPFEVVDAAMQYQVLDPSCRPDLGGMAGTRAALVEWVPVKLLPASNGGYRGVIYEDFLKDDDYYGLGVCHWTMVAVQFRLKATSKPSDAEFSYHLHRDHISDGASLKAYFWKGMYPRSPVDGMTVPGNETPDKFKTEVRNQLFYLQMDLKKEAYSHLH